MGLAHKVFLNYAILCDGVFSVFGRRQAYPNGADLLDFPIFGIHELCSMLSGQHPAAIVYATLDQGIPGVVFVLGLNVDDEANGLAVGWGCGPKAHIIQNGALNSRFVLRIQAMDSGCRVWQNGDLSHLGLALDVLLRNLLDGAVPVLIQAAFHYPGQDGFLRQYALAGCVIGL
jgi:hypothetical protein